MNNLEKLSCNFLEKESKYLYLDKNIIYKGINYSNFIPLKYESINRGDIKKIFGLKSWYLLWYLMANAECSKYIKTTIQNIHKEIKLSTNIIKRELKHLHDINIIHINGYLNNINNVLNIVIGYNDKECYKDFNKKHFNINKINNNGYRAIPKEYIKTIIPSINYNQWGILCILYIRYCWFTMNSQQNYKKIIVTGYAFPTQDDIKYLLGISRETIRCELYGTNEKTINNSLINNKFNLIDIISENSIYYKNNKLQKDNNKYNIKLFERLEYLYYNIYLIKDTRNEEIIKKIKKENLENIDCKLQPFINNKDIINYYYLDIMTQFEKSIKNKDVESYYNLIQKYNFKKYLG